LVFGIFSQHTTENHIHTCDYRFFSISPTRYPSIDGHDASMLHIALARSHSIH